MGSSVLGPFLAQVVAGPGVGVKVRGWLLPPPASQGSVTLAVRPQVRGGGASLLSCRRIYTGASSKMLAQAPPSTARPPRQGGAGTH